MEKPIITEEKIKKILDNILMEDIARVSRQDFNRVQFKIDELQNALNETIKELRKLESSIPLALKAPTNKKISYISYNFNESQKYINQLKDNVKEYKRKIYAQQIDEKKK